MKTTSIVLAFFYLFNIKAIAEDSELKEKYKTTNSYVHHWIKFPRIVDGLSLEGEKVN